MLRSGYRLIAATTVSIINNGAHVGDAHIVADVHVATKGSRKRPKIKTNL
jgi:hypothetical protein